MSSLFRFLVALLLAVGCTLIVGCSTHGPQHSSIPWSQPASWEGQIPGMTQQMGR